MTYSTTEKTVLMELLKSLLKPSFDNVHTVVVNDVLTGAMVKTLIDEFYITGAPENIEQDGTVTAWDLSLSLRGVVTVKVNSFDKQPQWLHEHPSIDCVPLMDETMHDKWYGDSTWADTSWHNDSCPSFESFDLIAGKCVKIWSENENHEKREMDDEPQYLVHLYTVENSDPKCPTANEFIDVLVATDNRDDVFKFVLEQEQKNELARREAEAEKKKNIELAAMGQREATFLDMVETRDFSLNMYDAMECQFPELNAQCGFIYFDSWYITIEQKTGMFYVQVSNCPDSFDTIKEAELYLWNSHVKYEADPITIKEFAITWEAGSYKNADSAIERIEYFVDDIGFDDDDRANIDKLSVGENVLLGAGDVMVVRLK